MAHDMVSAAIRLADGKTRYTASAGENPPFSIDYDPPVGTGKGYNSMELLLLSFASCTATSLITLMRDRMRCTITGLQASASGVLRDEHPKTFRKITLALTLESPDATDEKVERALKTAEDKICPVWALLKGNVEVETHYTIQR